MKRILLTILISTMPVYAFEDYMIISNSPVKSVTSKDEEILSVKPIFTIDNEKKIIIVTPKSKGKTKINVILDDGEKVIDVKVTENSTTLKQQNGFNYFLIDTPPKEYNIPLPPANVKVQEPPKYTGGN